MKKRLVVAAIAGMCVISLATEAKGFDPEDSAKYFNWFNLDPQQDNIPGISTDRAYQNLLKNKTSTMVIVAVIDGGVDINHEDLKDKIWTNEDEIPDNGIDDDHNGFIDDVHGWNFIGGKDGQDIDQENYEITRIYREYKPVFGNKEKKDISKEDLDKFNLYEAAKKTYFEKYTKAANEWMFIQKFEENFNKADSIAKELLNKNDYDVDDLKSLDAVGNADALKAKAMLLSLYEKGFSKGVLDKYEKYVGTKVNYHFNLNFNPRKIVGDDPYDINDSIYGNNDVTGPDPNHGTFVSGIIAADRFNNTGMQGIADNVKIMSVRTVPDGDERDKDVANAIKYAVRNGAQVINMSFGKDLSPQKEFVDEALRFAAAHDVLLVHAAGNENQNTDKSPRYPTNLDADNNVINSNWLSIGASTINKDETLTGVFSNYGRKSVDIFAPGVDIYSLQPDNKYDIQDGTSYASPMVAGTAALIKSYYPELTAGQIKAIILSSGTDYSALRVVVPHDSDTKKQKKEKFRKLSVTGDVLNVYRALELAEKYSQSVTTTK